jgi:hypothetical protein
MIVFGMDLLAGAEAALKPDAPLKAGKHCKFCKAKGLCPEYRNQALAVAGQEFDLEAAPEELILPDPKLLTIEQVSGYLPKLGILSAWIKDIWSFVHAEASAGRPVPGMKLVAKDANRSWAVDEATLLKEAKKHGKKKADLYADPKLKSPAQVEKLFKFDKAFTKRESSGTVLVAESDPRPAVISTPRDGSEFELEDHSDQ